MKKILYKKATNSETDIDSLYDLSVAFETYNKTVSTRPHEHFTGNWQDYFREEIIESLSNKESWVFLAIDPEESQPVGFIYSRICKGCYRFIIEELFVSEVYRGNKIGQQLLKLALDEAKKHEYPIVVEVFDWNKSAQEFYKTNGFEQDSVLLKPVK